MYILILMVSMLFGFSIEIYSQDVSFDNLFSKEGLLVKEEVINLHVSQRDTNQEITSIDKSMLGEYNKLSKKLGKLLFGNINHGREKEIEQLELLLTLRAKFRMSSKKEIMIISEQIGMIISVAIIPAAILGESEKRENFDILPEWQRKFYVDQETRAKLYDIARENYILSNDENSCLRYLFTEQNWLKSMGYKGSFDITVAVDEIINDLTKDIKDKYKLQNLSKWGELSSSVAFDRKILFEKNDDLLVLRYMMLENGYAATAYWLASIFKEFGNLESYLKKSFPEAKSLKVVSPQYDIRLVSSQPLDGEIMEPLVLRATGFWTGDHLELIGGKTDRADKSNDISENPDNQNPSNNNGGDHNTVKDPNDGSNSVTDTDHNSQSARKTGKRQRTKNERGDSFNWIIYLIAGLLVSTIVIFLIRAKLNRQRS